ncbi:MAG: translocation/assembly module TamB domain-containing protein [Candidatus Latescibacterota bacterium]|nr:translocation/assembly module TamB domain-containing protein [Candidatus Latescibacterota bacterium]
MSRLLRRAATVLGAVLALVLLTPLGPAALARLLARGLGEWRVAVGESSGVLLFGFSFADLHCQNSALGLDVAIASLEFAPWSWAVAVRAPKVRIESVAEDRDAVDEASADIELPIALLPEFSVIAGQLDVPLGASALAVRDWQASYRTLGDTTGQLVLESSEVQVLGAGMGLRLALDLSPHWIGNGVLDLWRVSEGLKVETRTSFVLGLLLPQPLRVVAGADIRADSLEGDLLVELDGVLTPLQLVGSLTGEGYLPALSKVSLQGRWHTNGEHFVLDSLVVALLGGELAGRANYAADSLELQLGGVALDMAPLSSVGGQLGFDLTAVADLESMRYAADLAAQLRDVELLPGARFDMGLQAQHRPAGATRLELQSPPLELTAVGTSNLQGAYDFELLGRLRPAVFMERAAEVAVTGWARPDSLELRLRSDHLPGELGVVLGAAMADLQLVKNRYLAADLRLDRDVLVARAELDIERSRVDTLVVALDGLQLARVVPELGGNLDARVYGGGGLALAALRLQGHASTAGLDYAGWRSGALGVELGLARGVAHAVVRGMGLRVAAQLDTTQHLALAAEFAGPLLRGAADDELALKGNLQWMGPLDDLHGAEGRLALDSLLFRQGGWVLRHGSPLMLDYRQGALAFEKVHLLTPIGSLDLTGQVGFDSLAVGLELPDLVLDGLVPDLSARGAGQLQLGGTFARPTGRGFLHLEGMRLDTLGLGDARVRLALADTLALSVEVLGGGRLDLASPVAPLLGRGRGRARLALAAEGADLGPVLSYALGYPLDARLDLAGIIDAALDGSALEWGALSGYVDVRDFQVETLVKGDTLRLGVLPGGEIALHQGRVALDSLALGIWRYDRDRQAMRPAGTLRLEGEVAAASSSQLGFALEQVDLVLLGGPEGTADLQAQLSGVTTDPTLAAELTVETEDFGEVLGRFAGDGRGGDWRLNWITLIEDSLVVTGRVPWDFAAGTVALEEGWLEAHSEGIGLFIFADLIADLDHLDGRIGADLRVEGLDSTMAIEGQVGVEGLELALLDIEPIYALPDGQLRFDGRQVELVGFSARGEPKRGYRSLELSGRLDLARLDDPGFDLRLKAERVASRYEDIFQADDIDLDLTFAGAASGSKLAGRIRLDQPRSEPTLVVFNAPPVPPPPPALRDEFLENMALAVELDLRELALDSELAEVVASGAVEIGGTFYKPLFQGDMAIDEGRIYLLNQQFEFESGRVVFNSLEPVGSILDVAYDPLELDPELDLRAATRVRDIQDDEEYLVTLRLQGRAEEVVPQFSSEPSKDFTSIVNLLAFNTISFQHAQYTTALGTVAGQLLSRRVEKVGLDEFAVLPSSSLIGALPGDPAIRVGKYFGGLPLPLWVRYEALLKEMSSGEVRIEHKLKSLLTISGSAQSEYDRYGLGIGVKKEY